MARVTVVLFACVDPRPHSQWEKRGARSGPFPMFHLSFPGCAADKSPSTTWMWPGSTWTLMRHPLDSRQKGSTGVCAWCHLVRTQNPSRVNQLGFESDTLVLLFFPTSVLIWHTRVSHMGFLCECLFRIKPWLPGCTLWRSGSLIIWIHPLKSPLKGEVKFGG